MFNQFSLSHLTTLVLILSKEVWLGLLLKLGHLQILDNRNINYNNKPINLISPKQSTATTFSRKLDGQPSESPVEAVIMAF